MSFGKNFWLGAVAAASLALYLLLILRYPLAPSLDTPRASWVSLIEPNLLHAGQHLGIYLGLTLLYLAAMHLLTVSAKEPAARPRRQILLIITAWLACSAVLLAGAPGGESHDIFDYTFRGRMMAEYQANPLVDVPADFDLSTPYARYLAWRKNVDTYGPLWEAASASVAVSVRQTARRLGWWSEAYPVCPKSPESCRLLSVYLTGYRLLAILMTGISGGLIASIVYRSRPGLLPLALAAWFWNPLTLVASALGAHNDALMLALVLLCFWLLQRRRPYFALLALILAAHVKLTALIWLPACGLWILWRYGWKDALKIGLASAVSGLALSWLLYAPFGGWSSLPRMLHERSLYLANSPWRILKTLLVNRWSWSNPDSQQLTVNLANWLFGIGALLIPLWVFNLRPRRQRGPTHRVGAPTFSEDADRKLWRAMAVTSLLYLVVGSFWFQHWYILWVIAPAVLLPDSRLTRSILPWLAFGALSANFAMDYLMTTLLQSTPQIWEYIIVVLIIWTPVVIASGIRFLPRRIRMTKIQTAS